MKKTGTNGSERNQNQPLIRVIALVVAVAMCESIAQAQQAKTISKIGYLAATDPGREAARAEGIRLALRDRGHIEGKNIAIEYRYAEGKLDRVAALAAELVQLKVDLIIAAGGVIPIRAAKNATTTIPIVMVGQGADPVESGLVESLARPGGNVTGITQLSRELGGKRLELLKEAVGKIGRVAVLYDPAIPGTTLEVKEFLPSAARALRLTVQSWEVRGKDDFDRVFSEMGKQRTDGLYVPGGGPLIITNLKLIASLALKGRLPSIYQSRDAVEAGGLMSYGANVADSYERVAYYIDKILKGTKPADLPVEQPTKFEFVINLKAAKQIGLAIPPNVLVRADRVIR